MFETVSSDIIKEILSWFRTRYVRSFALVNKRVMSIARQLYKNQRHLLEGIIYQQGRRPLLLYPDDTLECFMEAYFSNFSLSYIKLYNKDKILLSCIIYSRFKWRIYLAKYNTIHNQYIVSDNRYNGEKYSIEYNLNWTIDEEVTINQVYLNIQYIYIQPKRKAGKCLSCCFSCGNKKISDENCTKCHVKWCSECELWLNTCSLCTVTKCFFEKCIKECCICNKLVCLTCFNLLNKVCLTCYKKDPMSMID